VLASALFVGFEFTPWYPRSDAGFEAAFFWWLGFLLNTVDIPAALVIWVAMILHCATRNLSSKGSRIGWLVLLFTTLFFGAIIYFFCVYRREKSGDPGATLAGV
jgi:hypothetical protein